MGDIERYQAWYELYSSYSFSTAVSRISEGDLEPGYLLLQWFFGNFTSFQLWLTFIALLAIGSVMFFIRRLSPIPYVSILLFFALGFMNFEMDGLRQTIAMSIVLWAYYPLKDRHLLKYFALIALASLFHSTAIVFIIAYPIAYKRIGLVHLGIFVAVLSLFFLFKDYLLPILAFFLTTNDHFTELYASGDGAALSMTGFFIQLLLFIVELIHMKQVIIKKPKAIIFYNLVFIGLCFQLFSSFIGVFFRLSLYFSVYHLFLLPWALSVIPNKRERTLMTIGVCIVFLAYSLFFLNLSEYGFFWERVNITEYDV